ncbi:IclR family transcriptional regulator [Aeromicrobium sp. CF4.19]|uniref:IclR family transcriptional regulator n=1 Tax=Aeromicrobium sp. CF4.19 TaxID=3373082 RepID=UPI003EE6D4B4
MPTPSSPRRNGAGLARDVEILDLLAEPEALREDGLGVVRIAELLDRDKAVISRALATLGEVGLVDRDPRRRAYRLGSRLYALAARTHEASLTQRARPVLRDVVHALRETAHLCVLRAGNVLTLASEPSTRMVGTAPWTGTVTAAWRTPSGRALLSDWDPGTVDGWYAVHGQDAPLVDAASPGAPGAFGVLEEPTPTTRVVHDLRSLHEELERVRRRGYATSDEELEHGVVAASAPVRDASGAIVAALNVSAPKSRLGGRVDELGGHVALHARTLTLALGGPPRTVSSQPRASSTRSSPARDERGQAERTHP